MRRILLTLGFVLALTASAMAQGCGPNNPNCVVPTAPLSANNNQAASTAWVNNFLNGGAPLASGKIWIGSAGNIATPQTPSGDLTVSNGGVFTLQTVNANVGAFGSATQCATITTNAKGLITAASATTCTPAFSSLTGSIAAGQIPAATLTNTMHSNMAAHTYSGNNTGSPAAPLDLTQTQLTAELNPCTSTLKGMVPTPPNNTTTVLRGDCTFAVPSLSSLTSSLGADVLMNNTANYFDGPSVVQGATGTWFSSGAVSVADTSVAFQVSCKLWDGATVMASGNATTTGANGTQQLAMSGIITSPAGNIRISCKDAASVNGKILFNQSSNSKDSTITAVRIQ